MTEDYIYSSMTWAEVSTALEFAQRFEQAKTPFYKRFIGFDRWVENKSEAEKGEVALSELRKMARELKKHGT